uniref:Uncharacterized protein n=1 Tax=Cryptomonas curvata TaxID=233186 RepID=A0A7S0QC22_9CRYP|mmetsp:Transcript_21781/g.45780  ORF Transcript_21781/g.45780 Transcript_21781/m.45780 type:complete len:198 (+) Transcript_21781:159-752(+)
METTQNGKSSPGLHLDDIQQEGEDSLSLQHMSTINQNGKEISPIEEKRREHVRLVKEYIECCKSPDALFDLCLDDFEQGDALNITDTRELCSFLRPASASVPTCPSHALSASSLHSRNGPASRRRDIPAAAAAHPSAAAKGAVMAPAVGVGMCGATGDAAGVLGLVAGQQATVDTRERSVYCAQVATALRSGRPVWL